MKGSGHPHTPDEMCEEKACAGGAGPPGWREPAARHIGLRPFRAAHGIIQAIMSANGSSFPNECVW